MTNKGRGASTVSACISRIYENRGTIYNDSASIVVFLHHAGTFRPYPDAFRARIIVTIT